MIDSSLRTWLLSQATITAITSNVFPERIPQGKFNETSIVYTMIDGFPGLNLGTISSITEGIIQLDVYSTTYSEARVLTDALITILNGYQGPFDAYAASMIVVKNIRNSYEEDLKLYRATLDINIHIK